MSFLFCVFFLIVFIVSKSRDKRLRKERQSVHDQRKTEYEKLKSVAESDYQYIRGITFTEAEKRLNEPMFKTSWFLVTEAVYSLYGKIYDRNLIGNSVIPNEERQAMPAKLIWINKNLEKFGVEGYVYLYSNGSHKYVYPESPLFNPNLPGKIIWAPIARYWRNTPMQ